MKSNGKEDLLATVVRLVDGIIEILLGAVLPYFLKLHDAFYSRLDSFLRGILVEKTDSIPEWFTPNLITYFRATMVIPCTLLLIWNHTILPTIIVVAVDLGGFLYGVTLRYWAEVKKKREEEMESKDKQTSTPDDDSFGKCRRAPCIV